jgi:hypothetical protein
MKKQNIENKIMEKLKLHSIQRQKAIEEYYNSSRMTSYLNMLSGKYGNMFTGFPHHQESDTENQPQPPQPPQFSSSGVRVSGGDGFTGILNSLETPTGEWSRFNTFPFLDNVFDLVFSLETQSTTKDFAIILHDEPTTPYFNYDISEASLTTSSLLDSVNTTNHASILMHSPSIAPELNGQLLDSTEVNTPLSPNVQKTNIFSLEYDTSVTIRFRCASDMPPKLWINDMYKGEVHTTDGNSRIVAISVLIGSGTTFTLSLVSNEEPDTQAPNVSRPVTSSSGIRTIGDGFTGTYTINPGSGNIGTCCIFGGGQIQDNTDMVFEITPTSSVSQPFMLLFSNEQLQVQQNLSISTSLDSSTMLSNPFPNGSSLCVHGQIPGLTDGKLYDTGTVRTELSENHFSDLDFTFNYTNSVKVSIHVPSSGQCMVWINETYIGELPRFQGVSDVTSISLLSIEGFRVSIISDETPLPIEPTTSTSGLRLGNNALEGDYTVTSGNGWGVFTLLSGHDIDNNKDVVFDITGLSSLDQNFILELDNDIEPVSTSLTTDPNGASALTYDNDNGTTKLFHTPISPTNDGNVMSNDSTTTITSIQEDISFLFTYNTSVRVVLKFNDGVNPMLWINNMYKGMIKRFTGVAKVGSIKIYILNGESLRINLVSNDPVIPSVTSPGIFFNNNMNSVNFHGLYPGSALYYTVITLIGDGHLSRPCDIVMKIIAYGEKDFGIEFETDSQVSSVPGNYTTYFSDWRSNSAVTVGAGSQMFKYTPIFGDNGVMAWNTTSGQTLTDQSTGTTFTYGSFCVLKISFPASGNFKMWVSPNGGADVELGEFSRPPDNNDIGCMKFLLVYNTNFVFELIK